MVGLVAFTGFFKLYRLVGFTRFSGHMVIVERLAGLYMLCALRFGGRLEVSDTFSTGCT